MIQPEDRPYIKEPTYQKVEMIGYPLVEFIYGSIENTVPCTGTLYIQLVGTGSIATLTINQETFNLNSGAVLSAGNLYEFQFHLEQGAEFHISGARIRAIFFRKGV
jgi:hypothetical protein